MKLVNQAAPFMTTAGIFLISISIVGMVFLREYFNSQLVFVAGVVLFGIGYAKIAKREETKKKLENANANIETLNEMLWGKKK
jgi:hypothetical protein